MISTEYEKDGEMRRGYTIGKGFDISQMTGKPLEERPQRSLTELVGAVLKDQSVHVQIEDNLPLSLIHISLLRKKTHRYRVNVLKSRRTHWKSF